jgi:hypothetical protein
MRSCRSLLIFCLLASFVGCSKPKETVIPVDTKLWDKEMMPQTEKLSDIDRQYVRSYFARLAPDGISGPNRVPPGTTLGEAIADQKRFEEQSRLYEALREKARLDAEAAAEKQRFNAEKAQEKRAAQEVETCRLRKAEIQRMREQQDEALKALQGFIEDAQKRLSTINMGIANVETRIANVETRIADVEKGIRDANASITALAPQIDQFKLTPDLVDQIPKIRENLDAVASATQRMTNAANEAGMALAVIEEDRKRGAVTVVTSKQTMQCQLTQKQWKKIQSSLRAQGFNSGGIDGLPGPRTVNAIREYQKQRSDHPDVTGTLTDNQVGDLLK